MAPPGRSTVTARALARAAVMVMLATVSVSVQAAPAAGHSESDSASVEITDADGLRRIGLLPPREGNPRNSEGDFIELRDGRILFVYTHFTGGTSDHARAHLASRVSADGGMTWSDHDEIVLRNEADWNIMSVSLLRLRSGEIAMFYLRKESLEDCRPMMRISRDEARTWSEPRGIIPDQAVGYYVLNNDRVVQLDSGRLIVPVALHNQPGWENPQWAGHITCYLSDDQGRTWRRSDTLQKGFNPQGERINAQEPGVVALKDGRLMMFCRTNAGSQYVCYSTDEGKTWSKLGPSNIISPQSPATIERVPATGELLMAWNDHSDVADELRGKRTPFHVAVSDDEGRTWKHRRTIAADPHGWYCYTAMDFVGDRVLLGHCAGDRRTAGLSKTDVTVFDLDWLRRGR